MERASSSTAANGTNQKTTAKHARLAEDPPSLPVGAPSNLNDHHHHDDDDDNDEVDSDVAEESDFDESTVKTEGGLISKLENLDERTFEDKKKVALRELDDNGNEKPDNDDHDDHAAETIDEATSNAGALLHVLLRRTIQETCADHVNVTYLRIQNYWPNSLMIRMYAF